MSQEINFMQGEVKLSQGQVPYKKREPKWITESELEIDAFYPEVEGKPEPTDEPENFIYFCTEVVIKNGEKVEFEVEQLRYLKESELFN